jgi:hypothetical protein
MTGAIIVYACFVLPMALKIYAIDKGQFKFVKIINLLITFLLSIYMVDNLKEQFNWLSDIFLLFDNSLYVKVGVIYFISAFMMISLLILLALRNRKAHSLLNYIIPLVWLSEVILFNFRHHDELQSKFSASISIKFIMFLTVILGIFWSIILLIYYGKHFNSFFKNSSNLNCFLSGKNI